MAENVHLKFNYKASGPQSWGERLSALRYILPMFKLVWEAHHFYTTIIVVLRMVRSFVPVAVILVGKLIIDTIVALREGKGNSRRLWEFIALEIGIVVLRDLLSNLSDLIERLLGDLYNKHISIQLMAHAATMDLYHFEDPTFYDKLDRARLQTNNRLGLLTRLLLMAQDIMTLLSLGAALFVYSPLLLLLLLVTMLPSFFGETHFATLEYLLFHQRAGERRRLDYLCYVGASKATAKEVQLFGLSSWLISRYQRLSERFYDESRRLYLRRSAVLSILSLIGTFGYYIAYTLILIRAANGSITLGTLTFLASSFTRARDLVNLQLMGASNIFSQALSLKDLFDFLDLKPSITSRLGATAAPRLISEGVVFEDVSFRYPGSDRWAVRHVSFNLRPGERIAFVGENGAGKTTLTKLLARLYDPTEGSIRLDGRDIREYDLLSFRRTIGIIFQDFVCYDWRFDENIGVGEIEEVKLYLDSLEAPESVNGNGRSRKFKDKAVSAGHVPVPSSIVSAAEKSLASMLLPRFPAGYRQMLGRRFEQGIELSGGEWQKIALARAYIRNAQVLILDEPTASLDARAEYEVFKRFSDLVNGRMAVIISHRFSTVRMADRIIVLRKGSIIEEGTHDDLMTSAGLYAELFTLQAEGYR